MLKKTFVNLCKIYKNALDALKMLVKKCVDVYYRSVHIYDFLVENERIVVNLLANHKMLLINS